MIVARRSYSGDLFSVLVTGLARSFRASRSGTGIGIAVVSLTLAAALGATAAITVQQLTAHSTLTQNRQWTRSLPADEIANTWHVVHLRRARPIHLN